MRNLGRRWLEPRWLGRRSLLLLLSVVVSGSMGVREGQAQNGAALAAMCGGTSPELLAWCQELVLAGAAIQRSVALGASGGSDIPGSPSTLGRRFGSIPRVGISLSGGLMRVGIPDLSTPSGDRAGQETFTQPSARLGIAVGVLDGFRLAPTAGGVLSVDLLGSYSIVRLPAGVGFGGAATGLGLGARVGLIRESFTLPGVSVSAMRRWMGSVALDGGSGDQRRQFDTDIRVTSYRATVGKNLFALGLLAGVGLDRVEGDARFSVQSGSTEGLPINGAATGPLSSDRRIYFVSGWFGFLVYQVSAELGYAEGVSDPFSTGAGVFDPTARTGVFDPSARSLFASLAFRITL